MNRQADRSEESIPIERLDEYFTPASMRSHFAICGLEEVPIFNRVWFIWRRLPDSIRRFVPRPVLRLLRVALIRIAPGYATFPVARKP